MRDMNKKSGIMWPLPSFLDGLRKLINPKHLSGERKWFAGHYPDWQKTRIRVVEGTIEQYFPQGFPSAEITLLELGAGHGYFSQNFAAKGYVCTAAEGRREHIAWMKRNTHIQEVVFFDAEQPRLEKREFNVVLHFGLLYHLQKPLDNLAWTIENLDFDLMFLETEVANHHDPEFVLMLREEGYDQAINNLGGRPTSNGIEAVLDSTSVKWTRVDSPTLDSTIHSYSWKELETPFTWTHGLRRFYVIHKDSKVKGLETSSDQR